MVIHTGTTIRGSGAPPAPDWQTCATMAKAAFSDCVNGWIGTSQIDSVSVPVIGGALGLSVVLPAGTLRGGYGTEVASMRECLTTVPGIGAEIARVVATELWHAWVDWAANYRTQLPGVPASFAAFPAATTPPVRMARYPATGTGDNITIPDLPFAVWPLSLGSSSAEYRLSSTTLASNILAGLRPVLEGGAPAGGSGTLARMQRVSGHPMSGRAPTGTLSMQRSRSVPLPGPAKRFAAVIPSGPDAAINDLAGWVHASFSAWKNTAGLTNLWFEGYCPTFAPPYVPVGSVTSGKAWGGSPGAPVISSMPFPWQ